MPDQDVVATMLGVSAMFARPNHAAVPEGLTAREYSAQLNSEEFSKNHDQELASFATCSERMDSTLYSVFPNFAPWAGFHPNITYRFRPNGADRPKDTPVRRLGENKLFTIERGE
ncbi:MAG: hypothetical protein ACI9NT_000464 [Bacteroidia bacterium]